jgi:hypothetical protein
MTLTPFTTKLKTLGPTRNIYLSYWPQQKTIIVYYYYYYYYSLSFFLSFRGPWTCPRQISGTTGQNFMKLGGVIDISPIFYAVFWQPFWKWQTSRKFWKCRIAPLMVTYHYVKFNVSIIIYLEVININVWNFNFPIGFYSNPHPFDRSPLGEQFCIFKIFEMSAIFKMAAKTRHKKWAVKIQHCPISWKFYMWVDNDVPEVSQTGHWQPV